MNTTLENLYLVHGGALFVFPPITLLENDSPLPAAVPAPRSRLGLHVFICLQSEEVRKSQPDAICNPHAIPVGSLEGGSVGYYVNMDPGITGRLQNIVASSRSAVLPHS